jgi:hypothetical protein
MKNVVTICDHWGYFTAIWHILWPSGTFCGHLGYFSTFWNVVPRKIWQPWREKSVNGMSWGESNSHPIVARAHKTKLPPKNEDAWPQFFSPSRTGWPDWATCRPLGDCFLWVVFFFFNCISSSHFWAWCMFTLLRFYINFEGKNCWATFWAFFSQSHLVTRV